MIYSQMSPAVACPASTWQPARLYLLKHCPDSFLQLIQKGRDTMRQRKEEDVICLLCFWLTSYFHEKRFFSVGLMNSTTICSSFYYSPEIQMQRVINESWCVCVWVALQPRNKPTQMKSVKLELKITEPTATFTICRHLAQWCLVSRRVFLCHLIRSCNILIITFKLLPLPDNSYQM